MLNANIVGILTLADKYNIWVWKQENSLIFSLSFYEQLKFHAQLKMKKFYNLRSRLVIWIATCLFVF